MFENKNLNTPGGNQVAAQMGKISQQFLNNNIKNNMDNNRDLKPNNMPNNMPNNSNNSAGNNNFLNPNNMRRG